ncbi:hypothetical protein QLX08_003032 [Tetragonisca angustula]|uniref:Uncharacterized protein n=1 Tax=Tetragonisca angustula TaxID=166442 RepID=A0AAW1A8H1_9HYME
MSYINEQNQESKYGKFAQKLLKVASISGRKVALRRVDQSSDVSTELLHEFGSTDVAIGDITTEVMITTMGKIPSEMFYLEDTPGTVVPQRIQTTSTFAKPMMETTEYHRSVESTSHSPVLVALLTALLIILLLCCITACIVTKSKRTSNFFGKGSMECEPGCTGINQPLLEKFSSSTNKTSVSSLRNQN